ncbi:MAG: 2'-5' RNA ligase family protein [Candidatus Thermoplasmatota archaeon]
MINKLQEYWEARKSFIPDIETWKPYRGWGEGNRKHLVFLTRILDPNILDRIENLQEQLSASDSYIRFPSDYYHITFKSWGFLSDSKGAPDDLSKGEVEDALIKVREKLSKFERFEIELRRLNLFPTVVFIEVRDNNRYADINREIIKIPQIGQKWQDYPNFIPHLAIGSFRKKDRIQDFIRLLEERRELSFGKLIIDKVEFVIAHWHKTKFPKFELIKIFDLK